MKLGLVLGGVAKGATDTWQAMHNQANADQLAKDTHAIAARGEVAATRAQNAEDGTAAMADPNWTPPNLGGGAFSTPLRVGTPNGSLGPSQSVPDWGKANNVDTTAYHGMNAAALRNSDFIMNSRAHPVPTGFDNAADNTNNTLDQVQ